jgi:hypothetical protein
MSYDRSTAFLKASSPQSAIYCFLFQFTVPSHSLKSSSSCLYLLLLRLSLTSTLHSIFLSTTCFRRQFLWTVWPIQVPFHTFLVFRVFLFTLTLCTTSSFLTWSYILLQYHISKLPRYFCSTVRSVNVLAPYTAMFHTQHLLVSSLNLDPVSW